MNANLFVFIDQLCHPIEKDRAHHVNNFIRTPQTNVVNKLDSIHTQLAIKVIAKQAIKNYLCMSTTTILLLKFKPTKDNTIREYFVREGSETFYWSSEDILTFLTSDQNRSVKYLIT